MLNILGVVQVPPASTLPWLKAMRGLQGRTLLEWVVRRVTDCERLGGVIVVASKNVHSHSIAALVPPDVPLYCSQRTDALGQVADALINYPAAGVVRVCVDQPLVDPELIDGLVCRVTEQSGYDYVGYCTADGRPIVQSSLGVFAEYFKTKALLVADREAYHPQDREQVTRYLYSRPDRFAVKMIPIPAELDREDLRLRVGGSEDWEHVQTIADALGDEHLDWHRIAGLLEQQPALRRRMAALNQAGSVN